MKLFVLMTMLCTATSFAGFRLPKYVYKANQLMQASAAAAKEGKPLVLLMTGYKSS